MVVFVLSFTDFQQDPKDRSNGLRGRDTTPVLKNRYTLLLVFLTLITRSCVYFDFSKSETYCDSLSLPHFDSQSRPFGLSTGRPSPGGQLVMRIGGTAATKRSEEDCGQTAPEG